MKTHRLLLKSAVAKAKHRRKERHPFPYPKIASLWKQGKTIDQITHAINRVDKHNLQHPCHSVRNAMYRMRRWGYRNNDGKLVKLSRRVGKSTVMACQHAGLRAWA